MNQISAKHFRWILIAISTAFAFAGISYQIQKYKFTKDEKILVDPPSKIMVLDSISSVFPQKEDPIPKGSLIIEIDKKIIQDSESIESVLSTDKSVLEVKFFDCKKNLTRTILANIGELKKGRFYRLKSCAIVYRFGKDERDNVEIPASGDLLVKINGKEFGSSRDAELLIENAPANVPLEIEFLRCGNLQKSVIYPTKYQIGFSTSLRYFTAILFFVFGLFFGLRYSNHFPVKLISLAFVFLSFVFLDPSTSRTDSTLLNKIWTIVVAFSSAFGAGLFSHFCFYFPVRQKNILSRRWVFLSNYALSGVLLILFLELSVKNSFHFKSFYAYATFIAIFVYHYAIRLAFWKQFNRDKSKSFRFFFYYINLLLLLLILNLFYSEFFHIQRININALLYLFCVLLPFVLSYYLLKYRYYDIVISVRRNYLYLTTKFLLDLVLFLAVAGLLYLSTIISIKFPNLHLVGTTIEVLNRPLPMDKNFQYEKLAITIGFTLCLFLLLSIRKYFGNYLKKKFYHSQFDYRRTASELSELIVSNIELELLAKNVLSQLEKTLFPKKALLLIFKNGSIYFQDYYGDIDSQEIENFVKNVQWFDALKNVDNSLVYAEALPEQLKGLLISCGFNIIVSIRHGNELVGALFVGEKLSEAKFTIDDIEYLNIICKNIAIAIVNAFYAEELARRERYKKEIEIAQRIQFALLPKEMPQIESMEISAVTIPALEVGGDFFDFLNSDKNQFRVVVGDVSGKGVSAAFYMSQIQGILRTLSGFDFSLKELLARANDMLCRSIEKGYFISAIVCNFDLKNSVVSLARAGHLGLYYFNNMENKSTKIVPKGIALGIVQNEMFEKNTEEVAFPYNSGDIFLFVSDGVVEKIKDGKVDFAENKILSVLEQYHHLTADEIKEKILTEICFPFETTYLRDDITILVVKPTKNG